ncbi:MAG TPA: hypothetical protein VFC18_04150 [Burkholderiales bacterium]|nr:hypothetical protein [Burkholderiales bacterium]
MSKPVYDPRGTVSAQEKPIAPRLPKLEGIRLGILDNTKWNANKLLRSLLAELEEKHGISKTNYYRKESFSKFADPKLIREIAQANDAVVTAIGD